MSAKTRVSIQDKHYDWVVYPDAYLAMALKLCKSTSSGIHDSLVFEGTLFKELGFRSCHGEYFLIYPIIFNFKHGIEIYLKGLGNITNGKYQINHDLKDIFNFIISEANPRNKQILQDLKNLTWPVIKKYYYGTYCPKVLNDKKPDKQNEAERYPEIQIAYDASDPYEWVTFGLFRDIENDIKFIEKEFAATYRKLYVN